MHEEKIWGNSLENMDLSLLLLLFLKPEKMTGFKCSEESEFLWIFCWRVWIFWNSGCIVTSQWVPSGTIALLLFCISWLYLIGFHCDNSRGESTQYQNRFLYLNIYWDDGFYSAVGRRKLSRQRSSQIFWGFLFVFGETFSPIPQKCWVTHCYCCISAWCLTKEMASPSSLFLLLGINGKTKLVSHARTESFFLLHHPMPATFFLFFFFPQAVGKG